MRNKTLLILAGAGALLLIGGGVVMSKLDSVIESMANAIQAFEGWTPGSRAYRNNNPGNLRWFGSKLPWAGALDTDSTGHVIFDSYQSGFAALKKQLRLAFENKSSVYSQADSLYSFFQKYAEGNQGQYAEFVANSINAPNGAETHLWELIIEA